MLGILIILLLSWLLLYALEKKSILALGLLPLPYRLLQFLAGMLLTALLCVGVQVLETWLSQAAWVVNRKADALFLLQRFWWDFTSVLTEELLFRGALLLILLRRLGIPYAVLMSAVAFGIYHWFSFGIFGQLIPMFFVFTGTGLMGYVLALAFARTASIWLPTGLHLGWNFTLNTLFSRGPLGEGLLSGTGGQVISSWYSLIGLWAVPLLLLLLMRYGAWYKHQPQAVEESFYR